MALASAIGYAIAAAGVLCILLPVASFALVPMAGGVVGLLLRILVVGIGVLALVGLYMLQPNEAAILTLFGRYRGTDRAQGLRWASPFTIKRKISLRARNLTGGTLEVNAKRGNPVEIGAVVVWRVQDPARAVFDVDDYENYVKVQAEAALRHVASQFACDEGGDLAAGETALCSGDGAVIALRTERLERFANAGISVEEARLSHLSYECARDPQVMLRRQQAEAIISARTKIVLCGDKDVQPIINAGMLYA